MAARRGRSGFAKSMSVSSRTKKRLGRISPLDPSTLFGAAAAVASVSVLSTYLAGRGIAKIDPSRSLSSAR